MKNKSTPKPKKVDFVHLHNHTQYSLLDGLTKVPALIDLVKDQGMSAVAITDHGTMSGVIEFYKTARSLGIKPIIGMEAYVANRKHTDKDPTKDKNPFHLTLLAMNNVGYQNLMKLSTIANLDGFYYRPRIDHDLLEKYNEGLIVLSGCIGGEVGDALRQNQYKIAKETAAWYQQIFGDRYYLEVQDHGHSEHPSKWDEQVEVTKHTLKLSKELKIPAVVTADGHYLKKEDQEAHEILLCVQTGSYLTDEARMSLKQFELFVTDPNEIYKRWGRENPELILNTSKIAKRCNVELELGKILIPRFPVPKDETEKSYLEKQVYAGLVWRYGSLSAKGGTKLTINNAKKNLNKSVLRRASYELKIIEQMKFSSFFLIIADFMNWGKDRGIVFGPGRGSAASSIVSYALKITELDPLKYDLLFERFLNPDRVSMPDFDIDIQDSRRDEVIQYCIDKYGHDHVANIVTFGRMAARNAVRDVARVLQVQYADADRLAKMLPQPVQGRHIPLGESIKVSSELSQEYANNKESKRIIDLAIQLEGTIRSHGVHAAGVVIAPDKLIKYVPLEMAQKGVVATQYSMGPIEDLGLLKIDFLGLSNLTMIKNALRIIKKVYKKDIDIAQIPMQDSKTFELLSRGETTGVFQLESAGMKRYLKELKPTVFEDIIAMVALYRPGPMAEFPRFIDGKNNSATVEYPHELLKPVLKDTYGVIVFQEQIIALLQLLAGYSPGEADLVRKAIGKKNRNIMEAEHPRFIKGCERKGLSSREAQRIWKLIQPFADYSFNKAHAACYGLIAYQTAYLKANYPSAFMAALMTSDFDNTDRLAIEINECKHMGLDVLPPDINQSYIEFAVVPGTNQIRFGMTAIKNVGSAAVEEILRVRDKDGKFKSLEEFLNKVNTRIVNRKALESLIKAGAFDMFYPRSILFANIDLLIAYAARRQKQLESGQTDLFGSKQETENSENKLVFPKSTSPVSQKEELQWERDLLGIYLSKHPLEDHLSYLEDRTVKITSLKPEDDGKSVTVGGVILEAKEITARNGQKMAFVKLADKTGEIELVVFPGIYQKNGHIWQRDEVIIAKGKIKSRNSAGDEITEQKILVDSAKSVTHPSPSTTETTEALSESASTISMQRVYIRLHDGQNNETLLSLKEAIDTHTGDTEVVLILGESSNKQIIKLPMKMHHSDAAIQHIRRVVGKENVKLQ